MIIYSSNLNLSIFSLPSAKLSVSDSILKASALVLTPEDAQNKEITSCLLKFKIPLFVVVQDFDFQHLTDINIPADRFITTPITKSIISHIEQAAVLYEESLLPAFTRTVAAFSSRSRPTFACPGHQGGRFLELNPIGYRFKKLLGEQVFHLDVPHASPELGDVLSHEGPVHEAEKLAAKVFGSDETFFVLNGTSTANKIVTSALISAGDLVLMDRNNHKSVFLGALVISQGTPVYLDNYRDELGVLGGYKPDALDENVLRQKISKINYKKSIQPRPFRVAIVQQATCDGVVLDAHALLNKIGHLCDYILFDSAWLGYEIFIESLEDKSPMNLKLTSDSPGIIVTQSVHKQMSGLSQTSQIHKKDNHIKGQRRHCTSEAFNHAFMLHSSTSPSYPLFMSLEVNAAVHANGQGESMWRPAVYLSYFFRTLVSNQCKIIKPYYGSLPSSDIPKRNRNHKPIYSEAFSPIRTRHSKDSSPAISTGLHYLDPCKVIFTTRPTTSITNNIKHYIPGPIVTHYLRECNFTPEKSDFYNFTILISPSSTRTDLVRLADCLKNLELIIFNNLSVSHALPTLAASNKTYKNLSLRELCARINNFYYLHRLETLQQIIFSNQNAIESPMSAYQANQNLIAGKYQKIPVSDAIGRIAIEGIIPYPPGVMCIAPGERFTQEVIDYLLAVENLFSNYPEFCPHVQGGHIEKRSSTMTVLVSE